MMKIKFNRGYLAALIVMVPALLIGYYEIDGKKRLGLPGVLTVLTQPMFAPEKEEPSIKKTPLKLQKMIEKKSETQSVEKKINIAASVSSQDEVAIDAAKNKKKLTIDSVVEKKQKIKPALHQGKNQKGMLLPNLILEADEAAVKKLLCSRDGFLLVEVEQQRYVLGVIDCNNPYRNAQLGYLENYPMVSDRYLSLPGRHFSRSDFETLSDRVIRRTGSRETPQYCLVFSNNFNKYLMDVQLKKAKELDLDLEMLHGQQKPVSIYGELHCVNDRARLRVTAVEVAGKPLNLIDEP